MQGLYAIICGLILATVIKVFKDYGDISQFVIYSIVATILIVGYPFFTFSIFLKSWGSSIECTLKDVYWIAKHTPTNIALPDFLIKCSILLTLIAIAFSACWAFMPNNKIALMTVTIVVLILQSRFSNIFDKWVKSLSDNFHIGLFECNKHKIAKHFSNYMTENSLNVFLQFYEHLPTHLRRKYPNIDDIALIAGISALSGSCYQCFEINKSSFSTITAPNGDRLYDYDNPIEVFPMQISKKLMPIRSYLSEDNLKDMAFDMLKINNAVKSSIGNEKFGVPTLMRHSNEQPHPLKIAKENLDYCQSLIKSDYQNMSQALMMCAYLLNHKNVIYNKPYLQADDFEKLVLESAIPASKIDFEQLKTKQF
ncbi:Uncharacterised protein [Moraxella lacunata]|uniref:Uncharacterized protein n=2 Tax=Moraxella lacunata TaxID=477 RepID=A0A378TVQ2_MORLA|nr:Uncharacterised protein [Moraxella lacunata]